MANSKSSSRKEQVKHNFPLLKLILSLLFILEGFAFLFLATYKNFGSKYSIEASSSANVSVRGLEEKPLKIYIPKLERVLYISDGEVKDNRWVTSPTNVSYLTTSAVPGSKGNTVMYGHNTIGVLGGFWKVHEGDFIYVVMNDGQFYKYQVFERKEIDPSQVDILNQTADSRLTIYTCSGFLDSARFVVVSKLATT